MPVQIGAKTHSFTDPTGLLSDCHRRIETFLETLAAVGKVMHEPPSADTARALQTALVYFRQAAPKHTADEEESLFPRLRGREEAELKSALSTLDRLEKDHEAVSPLHAEVERLAETYLETGSLSASDVQAFQTAVARLQETYREHIRVEDFTVFPLAARLLSDSDKSAFAQEMAARRKVPLLGIDAAKPSE
ncbi:MAG: hemerythrin domain-containing protein [Acidobacteriaceae bacterium]